MFQQRLSFIVQLLNAYHPRWRHNNGCNRCNGYRLFYQMNYSDKTGMKPWYNVSLWCYH
jgi:hypothetical protein